ncbi:uncharacterized protein LOC116020381 [Ipomoea triloba]|uniref:uncharacterized protein LOC116020381 n=1 Tax=Ipomoea triloba TaxID=35885 RepID=UPI00125DC8A8|nr:uncharacterized protein LOC116020381 [Ipomoea triloba]
MKLEALVNDLRRNEVFGTIRAIVYTIKFQKRGLHHAHILLCLDSKDKNFDGDDINNIISTEIPNQQTDPKYYSAVCDFMVHGPCGIVRLNSPCMFNGRCSKSFPKKFVDVTSVGEDGYSIFRRRDNGRTVMKAGVELDNRYVVPDNCYLLLKYGAHINVEWYNQSRSIKYLFKYVNKGNDRVTASFYQSATDKQYGTTIDEVKMYYDCRYVSPCEASWRILGFEIQYIYPHVERLSFHMPNEQSIYFDENAPIDVIVERHTVKHSMFLAWLEANKKYPEAKQLTYAEMPTKFVWKQATREFVPRQRGFSIGRVLYVPPGSGEIFDSACKSYSNVDLLVDVHTPEFLNGIKCSGVPNHELRLKCKRECFIQKIKDEEGEGCNIHGSLEVNKVAGNFHFSPGKSFHHSNV